ncbi:hypothetical protein EDF43_108102 [Rathayibacter sp. PhB179]|nr:hypothetical protein EDF49_108105 [Rathayibacter sp. PhB192]TCM26278.1 hypothetical protein EDF43_108102 [Rathayibacter sp. PhB179]
MLRRPVPRDTPGLHGTSSTASFGGRATGVRTPDARKEQPVTANRSTRDELLVADRLRALVGAVEFESSKRDLANLQPGVVRHP